MLAQKLNKKLSELFYATLRNQDDVSQKSYLDTVL